MTSDVLATYIINIVIVIIIIIIKCNMSCATWYVGTAQLSKFDS